jgi:hypothetical protein
MPAVVIGNSQSIQFERFQRDLLGQHYVTGGKCSLGREAPSTFAGGGAGCNIGARSPRSLKMTKGTTVPVRA